MLIFTANCDGWPEIGVHWFYAFLFFWRRFLTCSSKRWGDQTHDVAIEFKILKVNLVASVRIFSFKTCNCLEEKNK